MLMIERLCITWVKITYCSFKVSLILVFPNKVQKVYIYSILSNHFFFVWLPLTYNMCCVVWLCSCRLTIRVRMWTPPPPPPTLPLFSLSGLTRPTQPEKMEHSLATFEYQCGPIWWEGAGCEKGGKAGRAAGRTLERKMCHLLEVPPASLSCTLSWGGTLMSVGDRGKDEWGRAKEANKKKCKRWAGLKRDKCG